MMLKNFKSILWSFILAVFVCTLCFTTQINAVNAQTIKTPEAFFGFKPGADRMLFDYGALINYMKYLDKTSPRLKLLEIGTSPMNKPIYIAFISHPENIENLGTLKKINRQLALEPNIPEPERKQLFEKGKVFVLGTLSMHSGEVGPAQAAPIIAYDLLTTQDPKKLQWLKDTVYMMVPNHNPDGMDMVVNHYKKYKGTKYEGNSMPRVYHKYVGHDNNRDFVTLTQTDTKAIAAIYNLHWFPQVMVEKHQMGSTGTRYFVPPNHDPIAENIDEGIWNWSAIFGSNMMKDMTRQGLSGIARNFLFDDYWPGSTETCIWKNVIAFLTEAASVKTATPVFIEDNEFRVRGKGLAEYKKSINMPLPWPGGWWRLGDIVQYEISSTMSILKTASLHREDILRFRNDLCRKEVDNGKTKPPFYYILPLEQHDQGELVHLVNLLKEHGIEVYRLTAPAVVDNRNYKKGDVVVPLAQAFRPFIKEVMETQEYPLRHYTPGGKIIKPYDITSWSLPLHKGVTSVEVTDKKSVPENFDSLLQKIGHSFQLTASAPQNYRAALFTVNRNESFKAVFTALAKGFKVQRLQKALQVDGKEFPRGSFVIYPGAGMDTLLKQLTVSPHFLKTAVTLDAVPLKMPRVVLVETFFHDMDAGWTRFLLDTYSIPYKIANPRDFKKIDFKKYFDVVIFPNSKKLELLEGKKKSWGGDYYDTSYLPEYAKGIGKEGMKRLMVFLEYGGVIVSWGRSTELFMGMLEMPSAAKVGTNEDFVLPVDDISGKLKTDGLYCPGSLMKMLLPKDHPITLGMPGEVGVFFRGRPVFQTRVPQFDMDRRVIGKFPEKDILISGYCEKEEKVGNKSALVWLKKNKGQLVLFGFNPQFRASTPATYKLLFNSILL
ncbi:MAG: hypothetical protein GY950_18160 [bacterium]|nr:hypothetical protein [bacterium]